MHFYLPAYLSTFVLMEERTFLNDINDLFHKSHSINGLEHVTNLVHHKLDTHEDIRFYMLLYADDTVLLAESAEELQSALDAMFLYYKT